MEKASEKRTMSRGKHSNKKRSNAAKSKRNRNALEASGSSSSSNDQRTRRTARAPKERAPKLKLKILDNHAKAVKETEKHIQAVDTVRNHNLRLTKMIKWAQENYRRYAKSVVVKLTSEQMQNKDLYYKSTHDFKYNILEADLVKAYLSANKVKSVDSEGSETYYSFDHLRKFKDAILFGAKRGRTNLPEKFHVEINTYIDSWKKENQSAKKDGKVTEQEADPITFPLYRKICFEAVKRGLIFLWVFTVLQWNCMARSINIDNLQFNCFALGADSIIIQYWDTKKDKAGENTSPKNCYANPFDWTICPFTALGCYLCLMDEVFADGENTRIFLGRGAKVGSASHKYCVGLMKLFDDIATTVYEFIRPGHANAHGTRKGAAVASTSGTTCPPPPSSVARRGEWSLGKVFDIYWLYAESGDQYCGRILSGLDPHSSSFGTLPPHFTVGMENEYVKDAMHRCFPNIFQKHGTETQNNMIGVLLRCLASITFHSSSILSTIKDCPGHPLLQIPILNEPDLIANIFPLVTTKSSNIIRAPTGIPPHVKLITNLTDLLHMFQEERQHRRELQDNLCTAVKSTIEETALSNGNITYHSMTSILDNHRRKMEDALSSQNRLIDEKISAFLSSANRAPIGTNNSTSPPPPPVLSRYKLFNWDGHFWQVPKGFMFPSDCKRKRAWELWLIGQPNYMLQDGTRGCILPYRRMNPRLLPKNIANKLKVEWRPILNKMASAPNLPDLNTANISSQFIESSFLTATEYLKSKVCSYVWQKYKKHESWKVSTWSKRVTYQVIVKEGTEEDIKNLPQETIKNKKRKKRAEAANTLVQFAAIASTHNQQPRASVTLRKSQPSLPTQAKNNKSTKSRSSHATRTNKQNSRVRQPSLSRSTKNQNLPEKKQKLQNQTLHKEQRKRKQS